MSESGSDNSQQMRQAVFEHQLRTSKERPSALQANYGEGWSDEIAKKFPDFEKMMGIDNNELNSSSATMSKLRDDIHQIAISDTIASIVEGDDCQESTKKETCLVVLIA